MSSPLTLRIYNKHLSLVFSLVCDPKTILSRKAPSKYPPWSLAKDDSLRETLLSTFSGLGQRRYLSQEACMGTTSLIQILDTSIILLSRSHPSHITLKEKAHYLNRAFHTINQTVPRDYYVMLGSS